VNNVSKAIKSGDKRYQTLVQATSKWEAKISQTQADLQSLRQKLAGASRSGRKAIESAIAETESELALLQERQGLLKNMMQFINQSAEPGGLASQIDALERSVPEVVNKQLSAGEQTNQPPAITAKTGELQATSIWGTIHALFDTTDKLGRLRDQQRQTEELLAAAKRLQAPMQASFVAMSGQSEKLMNEPDTQDPTALAQQKADVDRLTSQYKLLGSALLPLSEQIVLLETYQKNLASWYGAVKNDYSANLRGFLMRILGVAAALAIVLAIFDAWRRAIVRYVPDVRRRYQFLLLRKIMLWLAIGLVILFAVVSELGSLATLRG